MVGTFLLFSGNTFNNYEADDILDVLLQAVDRVLKKYGIPDSKIAHLTSTPKVNSHRLFNGQIRGQRQL